MKFNQYLKEDDNELESMLSDFIEMYIENGNKEKENHYRKIYKKELGYDYVPHKEFIPKPSLDKIYNKDDFQRYQDYIQYSEKLFTLKFNTYSNLLKNISKPYITASQLQDFLNKLNIELVFATPKGTEEAYVGGTDKITFKKEYQSKKIPKEIVIHELGHILDNKLSTISAKSKLFLHNMKSSNYDFSPVEIFAESFLNYIINPSFLKKGWPEVYSFFNSKVPSPWKKSIKELIKL